MNNPMETKNLATGIKAKEIDIRDLLYVLRKRLLIIITITLLTTLLGGTYSYMTYSPVYQASSRVLVNADGELMNTMLVLMKEPIVLGKVVDDLHLNRSPEVLSNQINVGAVNGSKILTIQVIDANPVLAAKIANTTIEAYKSEIPKHIDYNDFEVIANANESGNLSPMNGNVVRNIIIMSIVLGLAVSIGLAFFLNSLDDTIKTEKEIEQILGIPVVGSVTKVKKNKMVKTMSSQEGMIMRGEIGWPLVRNNLRKLLRKGVY